MQEQRVNQDNLLDALVTAMERAVAAENKLAKLRDLCECPDYLDGYPEGGLSVPEILEVLDA